MVKYNFWHKYLAEKFGITKPRKFIKEAEKQIKDNTKEYLKKYGRSRWIKTEEIFAQTLDKTDLFNSEEGKILFSINGVKAKIHSATHKLRREKEPIIAGTGGKGYMYADSECGDVVLAWHQKFSEWHKRINASDNERKTDIELLKKIIEELLKKGKVEEARELEELVVAYNSQKVGEE